MKKILVVEDDKEINNLVCTFLNKNNYKTISAYHGLDALKLVKSELPDLILLDLMIPYHSGDEVLKEIRISSDIPVIVISARSMIQTKVDILRLGADDYLTKPFDFNELLARIEVNLKRYQPLKEFLPKQILVHGDIKLNCETKEISINDNMLVLTAKEYSLLELFIKNPQKVFSKQNLYESIWHEQYTYDVDTINTHVSNIRKKLKKFSPIEFIETIWGMGYKLKQL